MSLDIRRHAAITRDSSFKRFHYRFNSRDKRATFSNRSNAMVNNHRELRSRNRLRTSPRAFSHAITNPRFANNSIHLRDFPQPFLNYDFSKLDSCLRVPKNTVG